MWLAPAIKLPHIKVGTKLLLAFLSVVALLVLIAAVGSWRLHQVNESVTLMVDEVIHKERLFSAWASDTGMNGTRTLAALEISDPSRQKQWKDKIKATSDEISLIQEQLDVFPKSAEEATLLTQIGEKRKIYIAARDEAFRAKIDSEESAHKLIQEKLEPALADYVASISKLSAFQENAIEQITTLTKHKSQQTLRLLPALGVIGAVFGIVVAIIVSRSIKMQLGSEPTYAMDTMNKIASGDLSATIDTEDNDRSSVLYAVKTMRDSIAGMVGEVRESADTITTASSQIAAGNLAQRSADAAKEIKSLIGALVESVDAGSKLVEQASASMHAVVQSVQRVNAIIGNIANASTEIGKKFDVNMTEMEN